MKPKLVLTGRRWEVCDFWSQYSTACFWDRTLAYQGGDLIDVKVDPKYYEYRVQYQAESPLTAKAQDLS